MTDEPEFKTYLCEYPFAGERWCVEIKATSREDAAARLKAMPWGEVNGEILLSGRVPFGDTLRRLFFGGRK